MSDEKVSDLNGYSTKQLLMPVEVSERYKEYCRITRMKLAAPLKLMISESLPRIHNSEDLAQIIEKTRNRNLFSEHQEQFDVYHVRLSKEVLDEINTYCTFFKLKQRRCHFLYFIIEKKLLAVLEDVLCNE